TSTALFLPVNLIVSLHAVPTTSSAVLVGSVGSVISPTNDFGTKSVIVPVAVSVSVTSGLTAFRLTVNVSGPSSTASFSVATVNCLVSPAVPAKVSAATTLS